MNARLSCLFAALKRAGLRLQLRFRKSTLRENHPLVFETLRKMALSHHSCGQEKNASEAWREAQRIIDMEELPVAAHSLPVAVVVEGIRKFQRQATGKLKELFERLAKGQAPQILLVTCADSRIDTTLITGKKPGEIFEVRNVGNIIPSSGAGSAEEAAVEYAVNVLGVKNIVIMGHSDCGAMKALLHRERLSTLPSVATWLGQASDILEAIEVRRNQLDEHALLDFAIKENVLAQHRHLITHPAVQKSVGEGRIEIHAWVYSIHNGEIEYFDSNLQSWAKV